ncbi:hypothetical protein LZD57_19925 [Jiella sp. CBK1P-4]|uniref:Uncharacterized protein n=1 Tax=Jiella avicenniae TaxID=2907202 RepID=A0A9X1P4T6_9HYPH|nr:hypothetical protein [Jiella avicenniae]
MTLTLSGAAADKLRRLSEASGHDPATYVGVMLEEHFAEDMAEIAELKRRIESADAGNVVSHDEARDQLRRAIAEAARDAAE